MNSVQLGDVALINPRGDVVAADEPVSFVGMAQLDSEQALARPLGTRLFAEVSKGYTIFRDGDVLAAKITPCWENGKIGQARLDHKIGVGSTEFHAVRPGPDLDERYLLHFLRQPTIRATGELRMTGSAGQRRVPAAFLQDLRIPLPRLDEQRRIVGLLDQADAIRAKRRQVLVHLDELAGSVFLEMFGDPVNNPHGLPMHRLGDEATLLQYGPRFYNEAYSNEGIRIVRITDLDQRGRLNFAAMPKMVVTYDQRRKFQLSPGDIVFARTGATVGKLAIIRKSDPPCIAGAYFIRIRLSDLVLPDYVAAVLRVRGVQSIIWTKSQQSAQQNFSGPGLRSLPLPVPPLEMQREFAARVEGVTAQRAVVQRALDADNELFASLQARAFQGEL